MKKQGELSEKKDSPFLLGRNRKNTLNRLIKDANNKRIDWEKAEEQLDKYLEAILEGKKRVHKLGV